MNGYGSEIDASPPFCWETAGHKHGSMLHRKFMWRDQYSATGCSPALQAVDSKQAENLSVGKTKSYWTNDRNTIRLATSGNKRKRMDFRVRHTSGYLRYVGKVELVCSELRNRPDGRRKYLACNDLRATARQIVMGYRLRWAVELFHKSVKQNLGFEDVATHGFDAVISHVHWVYCAYILLHMSPPGLSPGGQSIGDKQRALQQGLADKEKRHILQKLTQIGGVQRYKAELRQALAGT